MIDALGEAILQFSWRWSTTSCPSVEDGLEFEVGMAHDALHRLEHTGAFLGVRMGGVGRPRLIPYRHAYDQDQHRSHELARRGRARASKTRARTPAGHQPRGEAAENQVPTSALQDVEGDCATRVATGARSRVGGQKGYLGSRRACSSELDGDQPVGGTCGLTHLGPRPGSARGRPFLPAPDLTASRALLLGGRRLLLLSSSARSSWISALGQVPLHVAAGLDRRAEDHASEPSAVMPTRASSIALMGTSSLVQSVPILTAGISPPKPPGLGSGRSLASRWAGFWPAPCAEEVGEGQARSLRGVIAESRASRRLGRAGGSALAGPCVTVTAGHATDARAR